MSRESIEQQVLFQRWLDEEFPEGGRVSRIVLEEGVRIPAMDMVVARLFCFGAREVDGEWIYGLLMDPNLPETDPFDDPREWRVWVDGLFLLDRFEHELWEGEALLDDGTPLDEWLRVVPGITHLPMVDAVGAPTTLERMKEWTSDQWIPELFPQGLEVA